MFDKERKNFPQCSSGFDLADVASQREVPIGRIKRLFMQPSCIS